MPWFHQEGRLTKNQVLELTRRTAQECRARINRSPKRVLLLPPDITRAHSGSGWITEELYKIFAVSADVHVIPTLGQHIPHTPEQNRWMFGSIPEEKIHAHDWRNGSKMIGEVPVSYVQEVSEGKVNWPIPVSLNKMLLEEDWDLIINIGHIVPHEVLGFANYNKNYFIGLGGKPTICASHITAATYGIENNLGNVNAPLRLCYIKAEQEYLSHLPDVYIQLVMAYDERGNFGHTGFYVGDDVQTYLMGVDASRKQNITIVPPLKKVIAVMQGDEFYSTWVANKAIYRTRLAMADGGELLIIAPGLKRFGEQEETDQLIRTYGYSGTKNVLEYWKKDPRLQDLTHTTAHLIHGSSEGRFRITYAPGHLTKEEVNQVNFGYADLEQTLKRYDPAKMQNGWNTMSDGEEVYYISSPSAGLWSTAEKLQSRAPAKF